MGDFLVLNFVITLLIIEKSIIGGFAKWIKPFLLNIPKNLKALYYIIDNAKPIVYNI